MADVRTPPRDLKPEEKDEADKKTSKLWISSEFPNWFKWSLVVVGIIVSTISAFSFTKYFLLPKFQKYKVEKQISETLTSKNPKSVMGMIYIIDDLTVNPLGSKGRRFVVIEYAIESSNKKVIEEIKAREPQLRNEFIKYFRNRTVEQILEPLFQEMSKNELMAIINDRLSSGEIDSLYYIKLVLQ